MIPLDGPAPLLNALLKYRLLGPPQVEKASGRLEAAFPDARALAAELIRQERLANPDSAGRSLRAIKTLKTINDKPAKPLP